MKVEHDNRSAQVFLAVMVAPARRISEALRSAGQSLLTLLSQSGLAKEFTCPPFAPPRPKGRRPARVRPPFAP